MINSYCHAKLVSMNRINVMTFNSFPRPYEMSFKLFSSKSKDCTNLKLIKSTSNNMVTIFELEMPEPYCFGVSYSLMMTSNIATPIDCSDAINFPEFDEMFYYDGNDLGAIYTKESTSFAVWAPTANKVILNLENDSGAFTHFEMSRSDKGVYRISQKGDLLNKKYSYIVINHGVIRESTDPYGYGASLDSKYSAVVDINTIKKMGSIKPKVNLKNYVDHIIYETNIRDFTEQEGNATNIENKGKYLGFVEKNRKTKGNHPAGLDYLVNLGITTVQLNPVIDFGSVPDETDKLKYNWGYDPINMFSLEGSYSLHPEIPMERLVEFKTMVNELHKSNIRVVLDVVYNHIYEYMSSCYEKIVPDYFFRRCKNGNLANASGCGDDVASERCMVKKMIIDSLKYFVNVFDVDGFRFDLMGLLDITTLNEALKECKEIKDDLIFYGEGWNMGLELPFEEKGCSENASRLPDFAFFNECVRDVIKGQTFDLTSKGYMNGDLNYAFGLKFAIYGSSCNVSYNPKYINANQSINYIECHDNHTLFDKLSISNSSEDEERILRRIKFGNGILMTLFGVPFIHMGQELGLSKKGNGNSYNTPFVNMMDYSLVDKRYEMVNYLKGLCRLRKEFKLFALHDPEEMLRNLSIIEDKQALILICKNPDLINGHEEFDVVYNPTTEPIMFELDYDYRIILGVSGYIEEEYYTHAVLIPPLSATAFIR